MSAARSRHVPLRRCAVCRTSLPQSELIRFARDPQGAWLIDSERRAGGRGVWLCRQARCHERKALGRAFRAQAPDVAEQLEKYDEPGDADRQASRSGSSADSERPEQEKLNRMGPKDGGIDV